MISAGLTGLYYLGMSCVMAIALLAANANAQDFAGVLIQVTAMILGLVMQCVIFAGGLRMTQRRNLTWRERLPSWPLSHASVVASSKCR